MTPLIEFRRWVHMDGVESLQYRQLFEPYLIASGDIVLKAVDAKDAVWVTVPSEYWPNNEK